MTDHRDLTSDERAALQRFANAQHRDRAGRRLPWKEALSAVYWYNARMWTGGQPGDGPLLHGLRNDLGPTWLYDVCDVRPERRSKA